ncbi:MAG TPA: ABC transporter permease subunit/CPBP intramembrane protease [Planctomycetaceae bacterium]|nr:ABC transporter permease subunit/CPBP intramembrane protease [Planctomycetaceae bacterium]
MAHTAHSKPDSSARLRRLGRLTLKELREILRDRRTIVTLVLMPLFMYPLLSIVFQQFFMSQLGTVRTPRYSIGFQNEGEGQYLAQLLRDGGLTFISPDETSPVANNDSAPAPVVEAIVERDLAQAVENFDVDVGLRSTQPVPADFNPDRDVALDLELIYREDSVASRDAAKLVEKHLQEGGEKLLADRLRVLGVTQRARPVTVMRHSVESVESAPGGISIAAVIPFILILMTVTGAVYPAIDLTAGERERGTLEILVAAPIPRLGVLFAKYVAVLTVALLTAAANLFTMMITISVSGLGGLLFGEAGISPGVIAAVFGLLLLFAAFFSAVLLVITSSARSFKEAQAYLIPLMLLALAPGILGLMPGLELTGLLLVTPLANIVLLGRDLFAMKASGGAALTVVASTLLYAGAAIGLAARIFGAETVLYSSQPGWADLFRRPREPQAGPTLTAAVTCLAVMFPFYFLLINLLGRAQTVAGQTLAGVVITAAVFGAVPALAAWFRRVSLARLYRLPLHPLAVFGGAVLIGGALWMFDHEAVMLSKEWRGVQLDPRFVEKLQEYVSKLRELPVPVVVLALAIVPAVFEEGFFRGYLFAALRSAGSAWTAIVISAVVFGLFHAIVPNPLASERLLSSTLTGLVLGWVRWRTGSVLPGMLLHLCHNGLLMFLTYYEPQLTAQGIGISDTSHLPTMWLAGSGIAVSAGLVLIFLFGRDDSSLDRGSQSAQP